MSDRTGSGSILFEPTGVQSDGRIFYSSEDQKIGSQILILNSDDTFTLIRDGNQTNFSSNGGRLISLIDRNQNTIEYVYDTDEKLTNINDVSSTRSIDVTYDTNGRISKVTGADNRSVSYTYDTQQNDLTKVTQDWSGRFVDLAYDSNHRLLTAVDDANRNLFENTYDLLGRLTSQTNILGTQIDSNLNLLTQATQYTNNTSGANTGFTYDNKFRVTSSTDALGNQSNYQYNNDSLNIQSITNASGNSQSFEYDDYGNTSSVTDSRGNKTKFYYQTTSLGTSRLIFTEKANGYGTLYEYDAQGNIEIITKGSRILSEESDGSITVTDTNLKTTFVYDSKGRVTQVKDADNHTTDYVYDDAGNVVQVKDGLENTQTTEYVTRNNIDTNLISKIKDALDRAVTFGYDAVRDLVTSIATAAGTIQYAYDSRDRQTEVTDEVGRKTEFSYNTKDQLTSVLEAGNLAATDDDILSNFSYNALGQLLTIAGPLGAVTEFAYDLAGRIARLFINENTRDFAFAGDVNIADVGEDTIDFTFNVGADVEQVEVLYKKKTDSDYQVFIVSDIVEGENQVRIEDLTDNTDYDFYLEYQDNETDVSYSRKYDFTTKIPELPVILNTTIQDAADTTASIKIDISKEIGSAQIQYHVSGETVNKTVFTESVRDAMTDGLIFSLENLRSGLDYDAEITITDRFGVTSEVAVVSFKTTGELSAVDMAIHSTPRFGQVVAIFETQAYISIEDDLLTDPFAEQYNLTVWDSQGDLVNGITTQMGTSSLLDSVIVLDGLASNLEYTYTLTITSRGDIAPVSGAFQTSPGGDVTAPQTSSIQISHKDPTSLLFGITPTENLKMLGVTLIDQVTQAIKKYYFFDIVANVATLFLLNALDAGRQYAIEWFILDTSGNYSTQPFNMTTSTLDFDETPPEIIEDTLVERTDTTAELHLETSEQLETLRVRYRIVGTTEWTEEEIIPIDLAFDVSLAGLIAGELYEYQYVLEDNNGNQTVTEWEQV